jgi:hypothetical protein
MTVDASSSAMPSAPTNCAMTWMPLMRVS